MNNLTINKLQEYIKAKDHKPALKHKYFLKLIEEVGELSEVIYEDKRMDDEDDIKGTIAEELFDVLYYIIALANIYEVDLEKSFQLKEEINRKKYN